MFRRLKPLAGCFLLLLQRKSTHVDIASQPRTRLRGGRARGGPSPRGPPLLDNSIPSTGVGGAMMIAEAGTGEARTRRRVAETSAPSSSDPTSGSRRVLDALLGSLSLSQKIAQMAQIDVNLLLKDDGKGGQELDEAAVQHWVVEVGVGSVLNTVGGGVPWNASQFRAVAVQLQQAVLENSKTDDGAQQQSALLPVWGLDSVHGANYVHGAILSPQPINLAATFNVSASSWAGQLASRDTRAAGISWLFSPLLGISLEPRWSRVYETFGEDPLVVGRMAKAMIDGIQRTDPDETTANPRRAAACAKHFVGYSLPRTGHDRSPSWIPTRHLYQYFVPPWKYVMESDGTSPVVDTVMESYTETDGVPNVANRATTVDLLRRVLRFEGVLVTDYEEMRNLHTWHAGANSATSAILGSLRESSIDMSMIPWAADEYTEALQAGVDNQQLSLQRIDASVRRILQLKLELGLIGPNAQLALEDPNLAKVGNDHDRAEALDVARQSIVLVENPQSTLPLDAAAMESSNDSVLVVGPTAHSLAAQSGGWTWQWQGIPTDNPEEAQKWFTYGTTVLNAARSSFSGVTYRCGVSIIGGECSDDDSVPDASETILGKVKDWLGWAEERLGARGSIGRAVEAADSANVVIVCVGEEAYAEKPGDIRSLRLPQGQYDLVKALRSANSSAKIIVVFLGGRPRLLRDVVDQADAVVVGFLPGPDAGRALLDVILGSYNPSARLPLTYPLDDGGGGAPYFHPVSDMCTKDDPNQPLPHYEYTQCPVQWPFGHGLSYATFAYSNLVAIGGVDRDLTVHVTVTNTGTRPGAESVLIYTFDEFRMPTPEYKRLRAFTKVQLAPHEARNLTFLVSKDDLAFVGPHDDRHYILDPTMVTWVGVGGDADCRRRDDPASNALCFRLESPDKDKSHVPACDAACKVWERSGCAGQYGLTTASCLDMCMAVSESPTDGMMWSNDGWGWGYVNCIESVVWGFQSHSDEAKSCSRMVSMCRNVFQTGTLDEFGVGSVASGFTPTAVPVVATYVALITALLAATLIVFFMNGGSLRKDRSDRTDDIQFTPVSSRNEEVE